MRQQYASRRLAGYPDGAMEWLAMSLKRLVGGNDKRVHPSLSSESLILSGKEL